MEVLEAIRKRRTVRVPFSGKSVPDDVIRMFTEISGISPSGDPISWRLVRVEDEAKPKLARIVQEDFGDYFQKDGQRFKQVFSQYPGWLRFSEAKDGIRLSGFPKIARHFYRFALGPRFGPIFGKLGIMSAEIKSYYRNIVANPVLFGVFLDRRVSSTGLAPIINVGSMLQNLRLTATSLGLCYQDLGWITATKTASDKARELLNVSSDHAAINFFRIGHADDLLRQNKKSDFRRDLKEIIHFERFGHRCFQVQPAGKTDIQVLDAIRGQYVKRESGQISDEDMLYILEAARWAPTGFNVQPFEYLIMYQQEPNSIIILEDRDRRDPDPGPCEALARGGVLQNIRLAARALGLDSSVRKFTADQEKKLSERLSLPGNIMLMSCIDLLPVRKSFARN